MLLPEETRPSQVQDRVGSLALDIAFRIQISRLYIHDDREIIGDAIIIPALEIKSE